MFMGNVVLFTRKKLGTISGILLHAPRQSPVGILRDTAAHATECISSILNPSPISHTPMGPVNSRVSGRLLETKMYVDAAISQAVNWNIRHLKLSLHSAKSLAENLGKLDKLVISVKDKILSTAMEFKAGGNIPEPIERLFL